MSYTFAWFERPQTGRCGALFAVRPVLFVGIKQLMLNLEEHGRAVVLEVEAGEVA